MACPISTDVARAAELLRNGGVVAFPTETVYGLGGNALDPHAVARIFAAKDRPHFDPLIVHIAARDWLNRLVTEIPEPARRLMDRCWPGPLTLVLPKSDRVPDLVTSGLPSVAVRMPNHPLALELIRRADCPVAAPSANLFGRLSPTRAEHVREQLGDRIDLILDGGPCRIGVESTVLQFTAAGPMLLRAGGVPLERLEPLIGPVAIATSDASHPAAPGMLPRHYAPRTPIEIVPDLAQLTPRERDGLLTLTPPAHPERFAAVEVLSPTGDLTEAAANFFAALHRLDAAPIDRIVALPFPNEGLGRALNDRLRRAAAR